MPECPQFVFELGNALKGGCVLAPTLSHLQDEQAADLPRGDQRSDRETDEQRSEWMELLDHVTLSWGLLG